MNPNDSGHQGGCDDLLRVPAHASSNNISPRPHGGHDESPKAITEHVIKVQCQAAACGATLQVKVPIDYFAGDGEVLVHCGECKKLLKVRLPKTLPAVIPPLVPTPTAAPGPAAPTGPAAAAARALQDSGAGGVLGEHSLRPVNLTTPGSAYSSNSQLPTACSWDLQQQQHMSAIFGRDSQLAPNQHPAASELRRQQARLEQLNRLATGVTGGSGQPQGFEAPAPALQNTGLTRSLQEQPPPRQTLPPSALSDPSLSQQQQHVTRAPMGPPAARPPGFRPPTTGPAAPPAGLTSLQQHSHSSSFSASGRDVNPASHVETGPSSGMHQARLASWDSAVEGSAPPAQAGPAMSSSHNDWAAPRPRSGLHTGCKGYVEVRPTAAAAHNSSLAARFDNLKQVTYQDILQQATRSIHSTPRSPVRNPYRALALQHDASLAHSSHLQQQHWQHRQRLLQQHQFQVHPAGALNDVGYQISAAAGYACELAQRTDQYRDVVTETGPGMKRRIGPGSDAAAMHSQHPDILGQAGKRARTAEWYDDMLPPGIGRQHGFAQPADAAYRSSSVPGHFSSRAASLAEADYIARQNMAVQPQGNLALGPAADRRIPAGVGSAAAGPVRFPQYGRNGGPGPDLPPLVHPPNNPSSAYIASTEPTNSSIPSEREGPVPPRPVMIGPAGLYPSGSDVVNNRSFLISNTPTSAAAAPINAFTSSAMNAAGAAGSAGANAAMSPGNVSPRTLEESWRASVRSQGQPQLQQGAQVATTAAATALQNDNRSDTAAAESPQAHVGADVDGLTTAASAGNYFTNMLKEAMTPEQQEAAERAATPAAEGPAPPPQAAAPATSPAEPARSLSPAAGGPAAQQQEKVKAATPTAAEAGAGAPEVSSDSAPGNNTGFPAHEDVDAPVAADADGEVPAADPTTNASPTASAQAQAVLPATSAATDAVTDVAASMALPLLSPPQLAAVSSSVEVLSPLTAVSLRLALESPLQPAVTATLAASAPVADADDRPGTSLPSLGSSSAITASTAHVALGQYSESGRLMPPSLGVLGGPASAAMSHGAAAQASSAAAVAAAALAHLNQVSSTSLAAAQSLHPGHLWTQPPGELQHISQWQHVPAYATIGGGQVSAAMAAGCASLPPMPVTAPATVAWGTSIDAVGAARFGLRPALHHTLSGSGGDGHSGDDSALLRRHNSAPVTTGVPLTQRQSSNPPKAAEVITVGPTAVSNQQK